MNRVSDLFLLLYAKRLEEIDEIYEINRNMKCFQIEQSTTISLLDPHRDGALESICDLLKHRIITAPEYDDLYVALSFSLLPGLLLKDLEDTTIE